MPEETTRAVLSPQDRLAAQDRAIVGLRSAVVDLRERLAQAEAEIVFLRGRTATIPASPVPVDPESLRQQDQRLLWLRVGLILIPTIATFISGWFASRGVTVDADTIEQIGREVAHEVDPHIVAVPTPTVTAVVPVAPAASAPTEAPVEDAP